MSKKAVNRRFKKSDPAPKLKPRVKLEDQPILVFRSWQKKLVLALKSIKKGIQIKT